MADKNLKYRELILILISENKVLYKLFNQNEEYHLLLQELIKYDLDEDELPSQKELLNALGISRSKLIRCMQNLLVDFKESVSEKFAYPLTKTEVWLLVKSRKDYWMISPTKMDFLQVKGMILPLASCETIYIADEILRSRAFHMNYRMGFTRSIFI